MYEKKKYMYTHIYAQKSFFILSNITDFLFRKRNTKHDSQNSISNTIRLNSAPVKCISNYNTSSARFLQDLLFSVDSRTLWSDWV